MAGVTTAQVDARAKSAGLPANWRSIQTTAASEAVTVWAIGQEYGATKGAAFKTWYDAAVKKDPAITPDQAVGAWLTGTLIGNGTAAAASTLGQVPAAAATGAENATNTLTTGPLSGLDAIGAFFNNLTNPNTWIRVAKVVVGGVLLIVGLVHITGAGGAVANVARKVPVPI